MAARFDANLGSTSANLAALTGAQTVTLTTTGTAAAATRVVAVIGYFANTTNGLCTGVTIGGASATRDFRVGAPATYILDFWSLPTGAGLASSSSIIASFAPSIAADVSGVMVCALSLSGVDMTNGGGVQSGATHANLVTATYSSGPVTATGQGIAVGGWTGGYGSSGVFSTTTGTQVHDQKSTPNNEETVSAYNVAAGAGSISVSGTYSGTISGSGNAGILVYSGGDTPAGLLTLAGNTAENYTLGDQILRPSSDIATTGWTNTPLFSKINDSSDGTFITATLA